jgi:DNA-binding NarL/FixJ family response regulator
MLDHKKVLILDASPIFRQTLKEVIRNSEPFVNISEAENRDQAESILRNDPPDVVFFDIALPSNNGIAFIASIRGMAPETCVVVLTSHDSAEHEAASMEQGADYFLSKERSGGLRLIDVILTTIRQSSRV